MPEALNPKVKAAVIKEERVHSKIKGIVTKETKELNTKDRSRKVTEVVKVKGEEAQDTKEAEKVVTHGHGAVATNGKTERTTTSRRKLRKEVAAIGNRKHRTQVKHKRKSGAIPTWTRMVMRPWRKLAHKMLAQKTEAVHGMTRVGKVAREMRKRGRGESVRRMMSKKCWHNTKEALLDRKHSRDR